MISLNQILEDTKSPLERHPAWLGVPTSLLIEKLREPGVTDLIFDNGFVYQKYGDELDVIEIWPVPHKEDPFAGKDLHDPKYASIWQNIKHGTWYLVCDVTLFEEDMDVLVTYHEPGDPMRRWTRRRSVFLKKFKPIRSD